MSLGSKRAWLLRYSAVQFVVLVAAAMLVYPGGTWYDPNATSYQLAHNFLSDLGATHAFGGESNLPSRLLFGVALVTIGGALIAFAWAWRSFGFALGRARLFGVASQLCGTLSGAAFVGVALAPVDRVLHVHNTLVVGAFGLLLGYVASLIVLLWRNRVGPVWPNLVYLALVCGYFALVLLGRFDTEAGFTRQVVGQKIVVGGSMIHIVYLTTALRRRSV